MFLLLNFKCLFYAFQARLYIVYQKVFELSFSSFSNRQIVWISQNYKIISNKYNMDQYSNLTFTNTTVVQQKNSLILFITILVFLVIFEMITLAEWVIAFIRNSHILGFCLAAMLFILNTTTAILMSWWFKRGIFVKSRRKLILCLTGFCGLLLWLVICFLAIKIVNFSQENEDLADLGYRDRFTDEWTEQAQACSKTTIQSRVQYTAVIKLNDRLPWKGDSFYITLIYKNWFYYNSICNISIQHLV